MTQDVISKINTQDKQMLYRCIGGILNGINCTPFRRTSLIKEKGCIHLYAQEARVLLYANGSTNHLLGFDLHYYPSEWGICGTYGIPVFQWIDISGDKKVQIYYNDRMRVTDSVTYLSLSEPRIIKKVTIHGSSAFGQRKPLLEDDYDEDEPFVNEYFKTDLDLKVSMTCHDGTVCAFGFISEPDYIKGTIVSVYEEESAFLEDISSAKNYYGEKLYDTHWDL